MAGKPMPGHKLAGYSYGVQTTCQCGWRSSMWQGPGARKSALAEWRGHLSRCCSPAPAQPGAPMTAVREAG